MLNFVSLLGWSPPTDQQLLTLEDMTQLFSLTDLNKSGATVDEDKLLWMNKQHFVKKLKNKDELATMADQLKQALLNCYGGKLSEEHLSQRYLEKVLLLLEVRDCCTYVCNSCDYTAVHRRELA